MVQVCPPPDSTSYLSHYIEDLLRLSSVCLVCVYPTTMNPIMTSETTSRQKCMRTDPTTRTMTIDLMTPASTPKTN